MAKGIKTPKWVIANLEDHPKLSAGFARAYSTLRRSTIPSYIIRRYLEMRFDEDGAEYFEEMDANGLREDFWTLVDNAIDPYR